MSREKLLWGLCGALAAAVVALAVMLAGGQPPGGDSSEPGGTADGGGGGSDAPASPERKIAQAGSVALLEEEFIAGLQEAFGREYVQQWLKRTVVRLEAQALGIDVSRAEIDEELRRMQVGYENEAEFYKVMREQLGLSEQALRDDALYRLMLEKIATAGVSVTEADVEAYIEAHPEEFAPTHDVRYAQIVVESRERAATVLEQLGEGVDFALLAQDLSVDEATAANGGDSGWVSENDPFIPEEVAEALADMQVGDVSPPLPTPEGQWRIVTLLGRRTIDPLDDSNVRGDLRRELALAQAPSLFDVESSLLEKYNAVDFLSTD
ncbi:foldase protein PrsA [Paenibacillus sp.]|uniref:foldase protein PrsA n=1 Tax=Paenibacillus sp. TaxID=58172 RepID=UPI002D5D7856|nr:peptidyl-prolyl cis-trans isomerase [Paenibacillus sp.]HZG87577.1 peptidyl-prolyl cis-trans isomerase [Paenibacillus sp.]